MAAIDAVGQRARGRVLSETALLAATVAGFITWQLGGAVDAWYHAHRGFEVESFLTWPHALLYAGWVASATPAALYMFESRMAAGRTTLLPPGYPLILIGAALFGLGGMFDMLWHAAVGFEVDHEALVSPSHLWLIYSSVIAVIGFVWAAVHRRTLAPGRFADVAVVLSVGILLRTSLFTLLFGEPYATDYASGGAIAGTLFGFSGIGAWDDMTAQVAGTNGMIVYAIFLALFVVVPLRLLRLSTGALALLVVWCASVRIVTMPEMWIYLPAAVGSALVGEAIWSAMGRGALGGRDGRAGYWAIAFAVPASQLYLYFATMAAFGGGIAWPTSLWTGAPLLAGAFALIASLFAIPPAFLERART